MGPILPERPFILCAVYYLMVVLFIGIPMWYYTCSSTRYSLPNLHKLETKLENSKPRLHLDISVVQLAATSTNTQKQSDYLRSNLPDHFNTSIENVAYNLNWRIRRPTHEENQLIKSLAKEQSTDRQNLLTRLESSLLKIHKSSNRFRLFLYLFEEPLNSLICDKPQTYLINHERFVFLCPGEGSESLLELINGAINEIYYDTVDARRIKKILNGRTDLLVSLVPEIFQPETTRLKLSKLADTMHAIYEKNVKNRYLELTEVLNIRLITQTMIDLFSDQLLEHHPSTLEQNLTDAPLPDRILKESEMSPFFHKFESRFSKHSAQSVHHILTVVPDGKKPKLVFGRTGNAQIRLLEECESNFIMIADDDKSLVLGFRSIIRRLIGLSSANLCKNCLVRRDVFMNSWEIDSIVGALTVFKLQSILVTLESISQQAIGVKIPKYVSAMTHDAYDLALKSLDQLDTKKTLEAYRLANSAFELSEQAYYDPSLLETLYFPDDTKYAIYLPIFMPLAFPFINSLLKIARYSVSH